MDGGVPKKFKPRLDEEIHKTLSGLQKRLLHKHLSELHHGLRAKHVDGLLPDDETEGDAQEQSEDGAREGGTDHAFVLSSMLNDKAHEDPSPQHPGMLSQLPHENADEGMAGGDEKLHPHIKKKKTMGHQG